MRGSCNPVDPPSHLMCFDGDRLPDGCGAPLVTGVVTHRATPFCATGPICATTVMSWLDAVTGECVGSRGPRRVPPVSGRIPGLCLVLCLPPLFPLPGVQVSGPGRNCRAGMHRLVVH